MTAAKEVTQEDKQISELWRASASSSPRLSMQTRREVFAAHVNTEGPTGKNKKAEPQVGRRGSPDP